MWPILARCGTIVNTSLLGSLAASASRTSTCLFHVLASVGRQTDSALENQSANRLLLDRPINQLLSPASSPLLNLACGFKVKGRLKRRCKDCYFVVRHQRLFVICKTHRRHKQMSMKKHERNTWILTDATQGTARAW